MSGAFIKDTNTFVLPQNASKTTIYTCPDKECGKNVLLCKGKVIKPYFRHNRIDACMYFSNPGESQIHFQAKLLIKYLLETSDVKWERTCSKCGGNEEFSIIKGVNDLVELEKRFNYNGTKIADVALVNTSNDVLRGERDFKYIIEVCHTHPTSELDRPEPWIEVKAKTIIDTQIDQNTKLKCIRPFTCNLCINNYALGLWKKFEESVKRISFLRKLIENQHDFDLFVRYRLNQCDFTSISESTIMYGRKTIHGKDHLKLDFHYESDKPRESGNSPNNELIISLFNDVWNACNIQVKLNGWKGTLFILTLDKEEKCSIKDVNDFTKDDRTFELSGDNTSGTLCTIIGHCAEPSYCDLCTDYYAETDEMLPLYGKIGKYYAGDGITINCPGCT